MLKGLKFKSISATDLDELSLDFFHGKRCNECIYWMNSEVNKGKPPSQVKRSWLESIDKTFGESMKAAYWRNKIIAWAMYAPPQLLPTVSTYPAKPSQDAVFLACLTVSHDFRRRKVGKTLLDEIMNSLRNRRVKAVETIARRGSDNNPSGPVEFYLALGFKIISDDKEYPLLRKELSR